VPAEVGVAWRVAVRQAVRRPADTLLAVLGCLVGTAVVTSSLLVGASLEASVRDQAGARLGPVDVVVASFSPLIADAVEVAVAADPLPSADGVLGVTTAEGSLLAGGATVPGVQLLEADLTAAAAFGGDPATTGVTGPTPAPDEVVLVAATARDLGVGPGGQVTLVAWGGRRDLTVARVLPGTGLAGWTADFEPGARSAFVAPGTLQTLAFSRPLPDGAAGPERLVLLSGRGGVTEGADRTADLEREVVERLPGVEGYAVAPVKRDLLVAAARDGASFGELFTSLGAVGVLAGIVLLVQVLVLLGEDRRRDLALLRAMGARRRVVVAALALEGTVQAAAGAVLGAAGGIAVAALVLRLADRAVTTAARGALDLRLAVPPGPILTGAGIGLAVAVATVLTVALGVAGGATAAGLRDLPPQRRRPAAALRLRTTGRRARWWRLPAPAIPAVGRRRGGGPGGPPPATGAAGAVAAAATAEAAGAVAAGVAVGARGWGRGAVLAAGALGVLVAAAAVAVAAGGAVAVGGPPLAAGGAVLVVRRRWPGAGGPAALVAAVAALAWAVAALPLRGIGGDDAAVFVVQGVVLTLAAVVLLAGPRTGGLLADRLPGRAALVARIAGGHLRAAPLRRALTLALYALVVFTLTFSMVLADLFAGEASQQARDEGGGADVLVTAGGALPVPADPLRAADGVAAVATLRWAVADLGVEGREEPVAWPVSGFGADLLALGPPALEEHDPAYADEAAVWAAVLADPGLAIADVAFLERGGGPPERRVAVGERITVTDPREDTTVTRRVVAISAAGAAGGGVLVSGASFAEAVGQAGALRHHVAVDPDRDPAAVAAALESALAEGGLRARTFASVVDEALAREARFFDLIEAYLALGLLIGIGGLGVTAARGARRRRRELAVLRALGASPGLLRTALLVEPAALAAQGLLLGAGLAVATAAQLVAAGTVFGDVAVAFRVPWGELALLLTAALAASVAAAVPAALSGGHAPAARLREPAA